jgi:hypothetical protein
MMFSIKIGSEGNGAERYSLYVPFTVAPGREISSIDKLDPFIINDYSLHLETFDYYYVIVISYFKDKESAIRFFSKLQSSLFWFSLKYKIGIDYSSIVKGVELYDKEIVIDDDNPLKPVLEKVDWDSVEGQYDGNETVVLPANKKLMRFGAGKVRVTAGVGANIFMDCIKEVFDFPNPEKLVDNKKLKLAIDLYSTSQFEESDNATFITLVSALEALIPDSEVSTFTKEVINLINSELNKKRVEYDKESDERRDIEHLQSRLGELKKQTIGTSMRGYIKSIVDINVDLTDPETISRKLKEIYNTRSTLLHEGTADEDEIKVGLDFLREFLPKLLERLFINEVS